MSTLRNGRFTLGLLLIGLGGVGISAGDSNSVSNSGTITVGDDKSVKGSVTTSNISGTAAHIHEAEAGKNGGVIIPLTKNGDNGWSVPAGAKLTDAQYESYKKGNLYLNVHTAANPGGEIRGQIKP